jgi:hypothetical protein
MFRRSLFVRSLVFVAALGSTAAARAGVIATENAKPVDIVVDNWLPKLDPVTYEAVNLGINGVIDGYPSQWSVAHGEALGLRVSTTAKSFRTRIYRLGWYPNSPDGPVGSRLVRDVPATPGVKQAFPAENALTGLAECKWSDSVTFTIPADWVTGHYVVRFTTDTGKEAYTFFIVRDDAVATKAPIVYVDTLATAEAYNPWPKIVDAAGKQLSGKSTYAYNSAGVATKASGEARAVEVSFDRPFGENWGLGIWRDWTVPTVQWLEQKGYEVAYADSRDLHARPAILAGRKLWLDSGHDEYWSAGMWDNLASARDKGLSLAWFSGNDLTWQIRFAPGAGGPLSTMVVYNGAAYPNESICGTCKDWGGDPEWKAAYAAKLAGNTAAQVAHLKNVTYGWGSLRDWDPVANKAIAAPSPVSRSAFTLEGLLNGPKTPSCPAGATADHPCNGFAYVVENTSHWVYTGVGVPSGVATGLKDNDVIKHLFGYEMDSAYISTTYSTRPAGQIRLGWTNTTGYVGQANSQIYTHASGAIVFAAGTINWAWALDRPSVGQWGSIPLDDKVGTSSNTAKAVSGITTNVLNMMLTRPVAIPPPPVDAGPPDTGAPDSGSDAGSALDSTIDSGSEDAAESDTGSEDAPVDEIGDPIDDDDAGRDTAPAVDTGTPKGPDDPIADSGEDAPNPEPEAGNGADDGTGSVGGCAVSTHADSASAGIALALAALALTRRRHGKRHFSGARCTTGSRRE